MTPPRKHPAAARRRRRTRAVRTFTLVELLAVLVVLGVVASGVALSVRGSTEPARLRAATLQLEQTLRLGRRWATRQRVPVWLQLRLGTGAYRLAGAVGESSQEPPRADERPAGLGTWRALDGVLVSQVWLGSSGAGGSQGGVFAVRLTPAGASLPWAVELQAGPERRVLAFDGVTGRAAGPLEDLRPRTRTTAR